MSNHPQQPPRRNGPLIARPQRAQPPPPAAPSSYLGQSIAGALGGMGYGWQQPMPQVPSWNGHGAAGGLGGHPMQHPLPQPPAHGGVHGGAGQSFQHQGYYGGPQVGPGGFYSAQGYQSQQSFQQPYMPPVFPQQRHPLPAPVHHHAPVASTSRTTAEGYTLSETYTPPPPTAPAPDRQPRRPKGNAAAPPTSKQNARAEAKSAAAPAPAQAPAGNGGQKFKCAKEGCSFEGSKRHVREHEEDRHLMFAPGREPKPWVPNPKLSAGARIEGTNISLDSPEAIAKWIEDRKKKWPSKQVVEVKEKQREERIAAGLEPPPRAGRGGRGGRGGRNDRGGRGRGHDRGGGQAWGSRADVGDGAPPSKRAKVEATSSEGSSSDSDSSDSSSDDSDDSTDDEDDAPQAVSSKEPVAALDDDALPQDDATRGPRIHPSRVAQGDGGEVEEAEGVPKEKRFQAVCRHWRKGNCALGESCPYLHSLPANSITAPSQPKRKRPAPPPTPYNPFARADPFSQLAERDIAHVVSDILYAVDFLHKNDWLRGVEGRVGQLDEEGGIEVLAEEEGERGGIEVLSEETGRPALPTFDVVGGMYVEQGESEKEEGNEEEHAGAEVPTVEATSEVLAVEDSVEGTLVVDGGEEQVGGEQTVTTE